VIRSLHTEVINLDLNPLLPRPKGDKDAEGMKK
jgi:hypothetical protein